MPTFLYFSDLKKQLLVFLKLNSVENKISHKMSVVCWFKNEKMKRQKAMTFISKVNFFDIATGLSQCAKGPEQNYKLKMWGGEKISVEPLFNYNIDFSFKNVQVSYFIPLYSKPGCVV